jgi:hypothetical protein
MKPPYAQAEPSAEPPEKAKARQKKEAAAARKLAEQEEQADSPEVRRGIPNPRFRNAGTFLKVRVPEFVVAFTFSILAFDFWNYDDRSSLFPNPKFSSFHFSSFYEAIVAFTRILNYGS